MRTYSLPLKTYDPSLIIEKHHINPNWRNVYEKKTWPQNYLDHQNRGKSEIVTGQRSLKKQNQKNPTKNKNTTQCNVVSWMGYLNNNKKSLEENRGIQIIKDFT